MTLREIIKELCKRDSISINKLESDLGFAKGYVSKLDKSTPNSAKLQKIANYFNVSTDYLLGQDVKVQSNNSEIPEFSSLIETFPVDSINFLSRLCKNERINKDLTEKYVSMHTDIELTDYLSFENDSKNIGNEKILKILLFLGFKTNYINGLLTGVLISLEPKDTDYNLLLDRLKITGTLKKALLLMYNASPEELEYFIEVLESVPEKDKEDIGTNAILSKFKTAFIESILVKNETQKNNTNKE